MKDPFKALPSWDRFIYRLSALGFNYRIEDHSWRNKLGSIASDEALRDIVEFFPAMSDGVLKLFAEAEGPIQFEISTNWEDGELVTRLRSLKLD